MKTEVEVRCELARVRHLLQQARDRGDEHGELYSAQQALGWVLDELQAPSDLEATIREVGAIIERDQAGTCPGANSEQSGSHVMAKPDMAVSRRLRILQRALGIPTHVAMANRVGVSPDLWRLMVNGQAALSGFTAAKIIARVPGMDRDWLFDGTRGGLSQSMDQLLLAAELWISFCWPPRRRI
jgi:hypothetical protein